MNNEQILQKAITRVRIEEWDTLLECDGIKYTMRFVNEIIFDHRFAKAFWGDEQARGCNMPEWGVRLQEMVISEDPLKYLEQFLND